MTRLFKKILLAALALCLTLGALTMAVACGDKPANENVTYEITVTCGDLTSAQLDTIEAKLTSAGGTASDAKKLSGGKASFELAPDTYTVELTGEVLKDYTYPATTVTKDAPSATIALTAKTPAGPTDEKIEYTVTVTCTEVPSILSLLTVELHTEDGPLAADPAPLTNGVATFTLEAGTYTVVLSDGDAQMLKDFEYDEVTLTKDAPSATIALTPKANEPGDSEDNPIVLTKLAGDYTFTPAKVDLSGSVWDAPQYVEYTACWYSYTPAENEKYLFTTEKDNLRLSIWETETGKTVLDNINGDNRMKKKFELTANTAYTIKATADVDNAEYTEGEELTWTFAVDNTPDLTPYLGTWAADQYKVIVTEDSVTYFENDDSYDTTIVGVENGILKFDYTESSLLGQETVYHYGLVFNGDALVLVNLESPGTGKDYYEGFYVLSTLSKDAGGDVGGDVTVPAGLDGVWTAGDGETAIEVTFTGTSVKMKSFDGAETYGTVTAYDAESGELTVTMEDDTEYNFVFEDGALTLYLDEGDGDYTEVPFTKGGSTPSVTLPDGLDGAWTGYDEEEEATYTLTFNGDKVTWETDYGFAQMTDQGTVTSYNAETGMIEIELDDGGSRTLFFKTNEITWTVGGNTVTFTKQGGAPSVELPAGLDGTWNGIDDDEEGGYTLTVSGTTFTVSSVFGEPAFTGTATAYDPQTGNITVTTDDGEETLTYKEGTIEYYWEGYTITFTKQGGSSSVTLPEELTGVWSGEDEDGEPFVLTFDGLNVTYWVTSGTVTAYDAATGKLTLSLQSLSMEGGTMSFELFYDAQAHTLTDKVNGVTLKKQGSSSSVELPAGIDGVWKGTDEFDMVYSLTFDGVNVTFVADEGGVSEMTFTGMATKYDEASKTLTLTLDFSAMSMGMQSVYFVFDPEAMTLAATGEEMIFPVTLKKQGGEAPSFTLPEGLEGVWTGYDDDAFINYSLTITGTKVTLSDADFGDEISTGTIVGYDADTKTLTVVLDDYEGEEVTVSFVYNPNASTLREDETFFVTLTKEGSGGDGGDDGDDDHGGETGDVTLPEGLDGTWEYMEGIINYDLTITGKNFVLSLMGSEKINGTVTAYNAATGEITVHDGEDYIFTYHADSDTITHKYNDSIDLTFTRKAETGGDDGDTSIFSGTWTGTAGNMTVTIVFNGKSFTYTQKGTGDPEVYDGTIDGYNESTHILKVTVTMYDYPLSSTWTYDPITGELSGSNLLLFTVKQQPVVAGTTAENPIVWDSLEGNLNVALPAGTEASQPSVFYSYTAKKDAIYSLSYTLNGAKYDDLNLIIYAEGNRVHPVAAWNTANQKYSFPFTEGTTYIFQLTDNSASGEGGDLVLTFTEEEFSIISAYQGSWVDKETPSYTLEITASSISVNGKSTSSLTLAPFNGGYNFVWEGKDCNISIGKTQAGGYESSMLFTFDESDETVSVTLYHPGQIPETVYGTEENPKVMQQSELVKSWSDRLSKGEYYWTFTATETKVYTLTTTIDHLCIILTDSTAEKDIVYWSTSEKLKEAVFEVTAEHVYVLYYTDASSDGNSFKTISFQIAEGGVIEDANIPQEILEIEWVDEKNAKNTITLTADEVKLRTDIAGITYKDYNGSVSKVEQTESGYTITFTTSSEKLNLVYDRAGKTLTFTAPNETVYTFTAKQAGGDAEAWTGTLPQKWVGTWKLTDFGAKTPSQEITITENSIVWTTGAGADKTFTITGYDEANMIISFKTDDGLTGKIERQYTWDTDPITAIAVTLGGTTYSNLRKA